MGHEPQSPNIPPYAEFGALIFPALLTSKLLRPLEGGADNKT